MCIANFQPLLTMLNGVIFLSCINLQNNNYQILSLEITNFEDLIKLNAE